MKTKVNSFGNMLKESRLKKELTGRALAAQLQVSPAHVWDMENGQRMPSQRILFRLARCLEIPITELQLADNRVVVKFFEEFIQKYPQALIPFRKLMSAGKQGEEILLKLCDLLP